MKETGRKMTTNEKVVAVTASPISFVASRAATIGGSFFSSMNRKMFSSTTIASSMTTPTIKTSANIVTLLRVKSSARIIPKVEMTDAGMAMPAMIIERHERMKSSTTRQARMLPRTRWTLISLRAFLM